MDKKNVYAPQPLNLEEVVLPEEVLELSEKIAKKMCMMCGQNRE